MNEAKKNNTLAALLSGECLMAASTEHPIKNRTKKNDSSMYIKTAFSCFITLLL